MRGVETLVEVETAEAMYLQHPAAHHATTCISGERMQGMDAVVLESGVHRYEDVTIDDLAGMPQYKNLVVQCRECDVPIFLVDLPYRGADAGAYAATATALGAPCVLGVIGAAHVHPVLGLFALPAMSLCWGGSNRSSWMNAVARYMQIGAAYTSLGFRSAVAAKKIVSSVVPRLPRRQPTVLIEYGAAHLDIGVYLQHARLRDAVIRLHRQAPVRFVDRDYLQKVCAFRFKNGACTKSVYETSF